MASPVSNQITLTRSNKFQMAHLNRKWYTQLQHDSLINFLLSNCRKNTELLSREIFLNKSYYIPAPPIFRMPSQISNRKSGNGKFGCIHRFLGNNLNVFLKETDIYQATYITTVILQNVLQKIPKYNGAAQYLSNSHENKDRTREKRC